MIFDERDRESVRSDLGSQDPEVRRLAVERIEALGAGESLTRSMECLGDSDWRVRKAAVDRIAAHSDRDQAIRELIAALSDGENSGRRNSAVETLVRLGDAAIEPLAAACTVEDVDVRKFAVDALAGIGDPRSLAALIGCLDDDDPNVRGASADALGAIGGEEATQALRQVALDDSQDTLVRFSALRSLDALEVPMQVAELSSVLDDPMLAPGGLALLGRCDEDAEAIEALCKALADGNRAARESAMRSILRVVSLAEPDRSDALVERLRECAAAAPQLVETSVERLAEAELGTQLILVQFLGLLGAAEAVVPILEAGSEEALVEVAQGTLESMGPVCVEILDRAWSTLAIERRREACAVLGRIGDERSAQRLISALDESDPPLRAAAARALGAIQVESALLPLVNLLDRVAADAEFEGDDESTAIVEALIELAGPDADGISPPIAGRAVEQLAESLTRSDDAARMALARVFGRIARREDAELISMLLRDPRFEVRRAAVEAIGRLGPEFAPEPLRLAIADEAPEVRISAARALAVSRGELVLEDLQRLVGDGDARVRATAVRALGQRFAADSDPENRVRALSVLGSVCDDDVPVALAIVEALNEAGADTASYVAPLLTRPEPEVVREAARCFGANAEENELDALFPLVAHPDWSVRAEVIEALSARGVRRAVPVVLRRMETEQDDFVRSVAIAALHRLES